MIHTYRLVYPLSEHALPQLWEWEQPYIDHLILNARTFGRFVVQWYFADWAAFDHDNTRIWETYYRPKQLFAQLATWQDWLAAYRQLIVESRTSMRKIAPWAVFLQRVVCILCSGHTPPAVANFASESTAPP